MRVSEFDFVLPEDRIASHPAQPRHNSKLLQVSPEISDHITIELPQLLRAGDLLVLNNTRVMPARLFGQRGMAKIELLLHRARPDGNWEAFAKPMKRLHTHDRIILGENFSADVLGRVEDRAVIKFNTGAHTLTECLDRYGHMPLPPYIKRPDEEADRSDYQTIFAKTAGAVAAPTASLHFTPELMEKLKAAHIATAEITLHVGAGTFKPVQVEDTFDHVMHAEWAEVTADVAALINATRAKGGRIVAVGTTALRTLESAATIDGSVQPFCGDTSIFITPGYKFKVVDLLLTNFHLPKSTLFMLVAAFIGLEKAREVYRHAIENNYRFYSYGDTSLLHKGDAA